MITFNWIPLELFANDNQLVSVRYLATATDGANTIESEGNHTFLPGTVNKQLSEISEKEIGIWIEQDTTIDGVNLIKSNLEAQLNRLDASKVDFPWLAGTFTIE